MVTLKQAPLIVATEAGLRRGMIWTCGFPGGLLA
jgi:hypothetical protein